MFISSVWLSLIAITLLAIAGNDYVTLGYGLHPVLCTLGGAFFGALPCAVWRIFRNPVHNF